MRCRPEIAASCLLQVITLFIHSTSKERTDVPQHVLNCARKVISVEPHVMKKLAGVQEAASIGAVAEVVLPEQVRLQQLMHGLSDARSERQRPVHEPPFNSCRVEHVCISSSS